MELKKRAAEKLFQESRIAKSRPHRDMVQAAQLVFCQNAQAQFRNISALCLPFLIALKREEEIGTRSGRAGPSFSVRPEKEAKGAVLHGTSAAES